VNTYARSQRDVLKDAEVALRVGLGERARSAGDDSIARAGYLASDPLLGAQSHFDAYT
jgi:hypothetical protein